METGLHFLKTDQRPDQGLLLCYQPLDDIIKWELEKCPTNGDKG